MGVDWVLALSLVVGEQVIGAINFYAYGRDAFADNAVRIGSHFAGPAGCRCITRYCWPGRGSGPSDCSGRREAAR
jgi:hypothetical protein